jgi:hypothetical protein
VVDGVTYRTESARIHPNGDITGTCYWNVDDYTAYSAPWSGSATRREGMARDRPGLPAGAVSAEAYYANGSGQVIGIASRGRRSGVSQRCIWRPGWSRLSWARIRGEFHQRSGQAAGDFLPPRGGRQAMLWLPQVSTADQQAGLVAGVNALARSEAARAVLPLPYLNNGGQAINNVGQVGQLADSGRWGDPRLHLGPHEQDARPERAHPPARAASPTSATHWDSGQRAHHRIARTKTGVWYAYLLTPR